MRTWTLRICRQCGSAHQRSHDGCVVYSHPMFPQVTEWAGVDELEVMPVSEHEAEVARLETSVVCKRQAFEVAEGGRKLWMERAEKAEAELERSRELTPIRLGRLSDAHEVCEALEMLRAHQDVKDAFDRLMLDRLESA